MGTAAKTRPRVLIVDDDPPLCDLLRLGLSAEGFAATTRTSAEAALSTLASHEFDVLVTDLNLPRMDGLELCQRVSSQWPALPVVVLTAFGNLESAVAAIRAGAQDFIMKPVQIEEVRVALERATLRVDEAPALGTGEARGAVEILGESRPIAALRALIARAAASDASVLVTGESGTGKELVARALHRSGKRREHPFVAVNCAAVPEQLLESELFGHVRGAFTDARASRDGLFAQANGGTIFLDEIGEMPLSLQPKLLRVLQERVVRPLGGSGEVPVNVRVIAATNRDIVAAVDERRFRSDLFFRLDVIHVEVPPLRDRGDDIELLARHFLAVASAAEGGKRVSGLSDEGARHLLQYAWPGNVRELQNCIERAVALSEGTEILPSDLPGKIRGSEVSAPLREGGELLTLAEIERRHILKVLAAVHGNKRLAARILGLDRRTLYRRLEQYAAPNADAAEVEVEPRGGN